jgi:hypothetical protein
LKTLASDLKRWRFWRHFGVHTFSAVGALAVFFGLADIFFADAFKERSGLWVAGVLLLSLGYGAVRSWPRPISQDFASPSVKVRVVEGDLFDQRTHLAIGFSTTFDTASPYVAPDSVQGQLLDREFKGDSARLDAALAEALSEVKPVGSIAKEGKQTVYPIGTVATIRNPSDCVFCVAYTELNERNRASGSIGGLWNSLEQLWESVSDHANGTAVSIPVIGGGQSRLSGILPAQDAIRFIMLSFVLASRAEKVCNELVIVVRPGEYDSLDRLELQSFLRSLRKS